MSVTAEQTCEIVDRLGRIDFVLPGKKELKALTKCPFQFEGWLCASSAIQAARIPSPSVQADGWITPDGFVLAGPEFRDSATLLKHRFDQPRDYKTACLVSSLRARVREWIGLQKAHALLVSVATEQDGAPEADYLRLVVDLQTHNLFVMGTLLQKVKSTVSQSWAHGHYGVERLLANRILGQGIPLDPPTYTDQGRAGQTCVVEIRADYLLAFLKQVQTPYVQLSIESSLAWFGEGDGFEWIIAAKMGAPL